jgi:integrase
MRLKILSAARVANAKPQSDEYFLADGGGLYLRVRPDGTKNWLFRYSFGNKRRKVGLGGAEVVSLAAARQEAQRLRDMVAAGTDPQIERAQREADQEAERKRIEAQAARLTVGELFARWDRLELSRRKDGGAEVRRSYQKDVLPKIGEVLVEDVTRGMVADLLDAVVERGARIVARNLLGDLRQMFGFAVKRGLIENDPTGHLKRDDFGKKVERDRALSEAEVRELARLLPKAKMQDSSVHAVSIMLGTCCRVGEVSRARLADVDLEAGTWTIPVQNAKNSKPHKVYLSEFVQPHFAALVERAQRLGSEWLLPAKNPDGVTVGHVCVKSLSKQIGDRQRGTDGQPMKGRSPLVNALALPGGKWTAHDLRRTGATMMAALGVDPHVIERCLNHVEQNKLIRTYQRHSYETEMREAWRLLGDRLALLVREDADNVVPIKRSA